MQRINKMKFQLAVVFKTTIATATMIESIYFVRFPMTRHRRRVFEHFRTDATLVRRFSLVFDFVILQSLVSGKSQVTNFALVFPFQRMDLHVVIVLGYGKRFFATNVAHNTQTVAVMVSHFVSFQSFLVRKLFVALFAFRSTVNRNQKTVSL